MSDDQKANDIAKVVAWMRAEIERLRVENDHLKQARSDALAGGDALREEITHLRSEVLGQARLLDMSAEREARPRARVEVLESVRAAAQALIDYEDGNPNEHRCLCWEKKRESLRDALKEVKP
jgi:FtsZ-binding cell division protein ZapB